MRSIILTSSFAVPLGTLESFISSEFPKPEVQAETWRTIVNRMPHDWFVKETLLILAAHIRHISTHKMLSDAIDAFEPDWLKVEGGIEQVMKPT